MSPTSQQRPGSGTLAVLASAAVLAAAGGGYWIASGDGSGGGGLTANVWVDTSGGTCTRSASLVEYSDAAACSTITDGYNAASAGDTVRVKAGDYGHSQNVGGDGGARITIIGENGTTTTATRPSGCDTGLATGLTFAGNVTVDNIDVGGPEPFVFLGGDGSTWQNSSLLEGSNSNTCPGARGTSSGTPEPVLIYGDTEVVSNITLSNMTFEPQYVCDVGVGDCGGGDVYHLETVRIDKQVEGVTIEDSVFESGGEDNTALVFITSPNGATWNPSNITIRNTVFGSHGGSVNMDGGAFAVCDNWTFAYNTFTKDRISTCASGSSVTWVGNAGPKSGASCGTGETWIRNVWQDSADTSCGTDTWVEGTRFAIDSLGLDANFQPSSGSSAVVDAGETDSGSDYCTGALGSVDRAGNARPVGSACDAGAYEWQG
jgi:hypothetical protein